MDKKLNVVKINLSDNDTSESNGCSLMSSISYKNPDFIKGLNTMFHVKPYEKISRIEIDINNKTISAYFERV